MKLKTLCRMTVLTAAVTFVSPAATLHAQQVPGAHPAYLHALSDLRMARALLNDGWAWDPVRRDDNAAIREIDAAIGEIKQQPSTMARA